ncbi:prophage PhiRv1 protein [Mycobacterium tuberculosis BTB03-012]|nr:prophage PhiRv1 protein [Mycobacterium tuberculosis BTB03-012]
MGRKLSRRNKWRRWPPDRGAGAAESQAAAARGAGSWPPGSIFWFGAHGLQTRIRASFDENRHCYRRSPRHLRRHLPAAQTNRQRNPQRRQRNPPVRGETNGAAGRRIAELERPKAKERQREGGRLGASITNAGFGPMEPKPSQRHTDKEVGAALGISAGTYKRLKRIDNATRSELARHLRRHLQAAQTNRQRNPQRRQRNPPVRGETNGAAGRRIAELERPKAKQRQQEGGDHGRQARYSGLGPMGPKPESERRSTKTDTAIGAALGISAGTYRRLKRIDNATRSELAAWAARHP